MRARRVPMPECPIQPGQPCTLCHPEARTGPQDCPTIALVMDDADLREELARRRQAHARLTASRRHQA